MRTINALGDRLLDLLVPRTTAAAADCGYTRYEYQCRLGRLRRRTCFTNPSCACSGWTNAGAC